MAEGKSNKSGAVVRHKEPIAIAEVVDELPPRDYSSPMTEILEQIAAAEGKWVRLDPAGRQPGSVQSMVSSAANSRGIKVNCSIRGDEVYARLAPAKKGK